MTEAAPYRSSGPLEKLPEPPAELVYAPGDGARRGDAIRYGAGILWLGLPISIFVGAASGRADVACVLGAATVAWAAWRRKRELTGPRVVLQVDDGVLFVDGARDDREAISIPLAQIRNVRLETKTIEKLQADRTIGAFVVSRSVRPATDVSRLVVVPTKSWGAPFLLSASFEPNFEAVEWLGRVRRFLRAYGWLPADEREAGGEASPIPSATLQEKA